MRKEEIAVARRAQVDPRDGCGPDRAQSLLRGAPEVEAPAADDPVAETLAERFCNVVAHLETARTDSRPDHRGKAGGSEGGGGAFHDPAEEASPPDVKGSDRRLPPVRPGQRDRQAVGRDDQERLPARVAPEAVSGLAAAARTPDDRAVHLAAVAKLPGVRGDLGAEAQPILRDVLGVVVGQAAEVERVERRFADAAGPRREGSEVRAGRVPADE
jgi:hypothetical protein